MSTDQPEDELPQLSHEQKIEMAERALHDLAQLSESLEQYINQFKGTLDMLEWYRKVALEDQILPKLGLLIEILDNEAKKTFGDSLDS